MGLLLTRRSENATVTICHTGTRNLPGVVRQADIVIAAAGVPGMIQPGHLTPGCVVVGAGVRYEGRTLLPDVDESCEEVAGYITPRVGGVGPTTIAMLFRNFVEAAERHLTRQ
jgi:methylenetetrahydrofolate dehydrogenase (NADP+)/methenyltetrahydrofolate cyclohydrolase